jgi:hypothetical protein
MSTTRSATLSAVSPVRPSIACSRKAGAPCRRGDRHDGDFDHGTMRVLIGYASRFGSTRDIAMRVILLYITAVVMPDDGSIHFAEDIYDHDTRLDGALELREMPK